MDKIRIDVQECHENFIRRFFSDGTIDEICYEYKDGFRVVPLGPNGEID